MSDWDDLDEDDVALLVEAVDKASNAGISNSQATLTQSNVNNGNPGSKMGNGFETSVQFQRFGNTPDVLPRIGQAVGGNSQPTPMEHDRMMQEMTNLRQQLRDGHIEKQTLLQKISSMEITMQHKQSIPTEEAQFLKKENHDLKIQLTFKNEEARDAQVLKDQLKQARSENAEMQKRLIQENVERIDISNNSRRRSSSNASDLPARKRSRPRIHPESDTSEEVAGTWSQFGLGRECSFGPNLGEKLQYVWQSAQNGIGRLHTEAKKLQNQNPATEFPVKRALFIKYSSHLDDLLLRSQPHGIVRTSAEVVISLAFDVPNRMNPDELGTIEIATDILDVLAGVLSGYDASLDLVNFINRTKGLSTLLQSLTRLWELWREVPVHGRAFGDAIMKVFGLLSQVIQNKQEIVALVTCGLLREALLSQCVLAQRGALDAFYAMEIPQGEISGRDTDAHNEATFALLESIFPSRSQGLTDSTKSTIEKSRWGRFECHRKALALVAWLVRKKDIKKIHVLVANDQVEGICGVVPRTFQLLLCALTELDKLADAVTTIHIETNRIDACMGSMEHVRLLLEGLTLIQGVMRMHSTEVLVLGNIASSRSHQECLSSVCWTVENLDDNCLSARGCRPLQTERWVTLLWPGAHDLSKQSSPLECIRTIKKLAGTIWERWKIYRARNIVKPKH